MAPGVPVPVRETCKQGYCEHCPGRYEIRVRGVLAVCLDDPE